MRFFKTAPLLAICFLAGAAHAQNADGERLFKQRCGACHSLKAGENRVGPSLADINGRPAGSLEGVRYSPALRDSGIRWDATNLDAFVENSKKLVPGTRMNIRISDPDQRKAITDYLLSAQ
ncbi:c-type cytochrome [Thalassospira marina]|uniref:Cytochrome C n=1 Tax=Thalassospira marina TaxID=2048283 RepID=A0ABM6QBE8_9PROT|nr:c-type cytochrome [Thalassospira marina]AUG53858.1 cytochrome C [Thalassospira marina]